MCFTIATLLLNATIGVPPEWRIAEAAIRKIDDFSAAFEANSFDRKFPERPFLQTGVFRHVSAEVFSIQLNRESSEGVITYDTLSLKPGGIPNRVFQVGNLTSIPSQQMIDRDFTPCMRADFPTRFYIWPAILQSADWESDDIKFVGEAKVSDLDCLKFQARYCGFHDYIYVSLERGGHVVRMETWDNAARTNYWNELNVLRWEQITDAKGVKHWFPVQFKSTRHWDWNKKAVVKDPVSWVEFLFVPASIKINTGLKVKDVEVKFDSRVHVMHLQKPPKTVANKQEVISQPKIYIADLRKTLAEADAQKAELDDRRRAPPPDDLLPWVWIVGIIALFLGGAAVYFKVRQGA